MGYASIKRTQLLYLVFMALAYLKIIQRELKAVWALVEVNVNMRYIMKCSY